MTTVIEQSHWELIPLRTSRLDIFEIRCHLYCIETISRWSNYCIVGGSSHLKSAISHHTYVDIIYIWYCKILIINKLVNAHTSRYRKNEWHGQLSWTINRYHGSSPYERVSMVGKGQFDMLTSILNSSQIYIIPYRGTSLDLSTLVPIESHEILAQAWTSSFINHIKSKLKRLISCNLQIYVSSLYFVRSFLKLYQLFNQFA